MWNQNVVRILRPAPWGSGQGGQTTWFFLNCGSRNRRSRRVQGEPDGCWHAEDGAKSIAGVVDGESVRYQLRRFSYKHGKQGTGWTKMEISLKENPMVLYMVYKTSRRRRHPETSMAACSSADAAVVATSGLRLAILNLPLDQAAKKAEECDSEKMPEILEYLVVPNLHSPINEIGLDRSIVPESLDELEVQPGQVELAATIISEFGRTQQLMISSASSYGVKRKADANHPNAPSGTRHRQARSTDTDPDDGWVWRNIFSDSVSQGDNNTIPVGVDDSRAVFADMPHYFADYQLELEKPVGFKGGWNQPHRFPFDAQVEAEQQPGPEAGEMAEEAGGSAPRTSSPAMYCHFALKDSTLRSLSDNGAGYSTGELEHSMPIEASFGGEPFFPLNQWESDDYSMPTAPWMPTAEFDDAGFDFDPFINNLLEDAYACG